MTREIARLQEVLDRLCPAGPSRTVLEAGCGSMSHIRIHGATLTGIDTSPEQLERHPGLDRAILGDIQIYALPAAAFDAIVCWDVLEHLEAPRKALANFARALKAGGILVLAAPNLWSIKGLMTRLTPHPVHVWAYRHLWGVARAGTRGHAPFRTHLKLAMARGAVVRFGRARGLEVEYLDAYEAMMQVRLRKDHRIAGALIALATAVGKVVTLGRLDLSLSDYILVLRKKQ